MPHDGPKCFPARHLLADGPTHQPRPLLADGSTYQPRLEFLHRPLHSHEIAALCHVSQQFHLLWRASVFHDFGGGLLHGPENRRRKLEPISISTTQFRIAGREDLEHLRPVGLAVRIRHELRQRVVHKRRQVVACHVRNS